MQSCGIHQVRVHIEDLDDFLWAIREIATHRNTHIVLFNARHMAGRAHVESALRHAFRAREQGAMISSRVEMDALLYAAGSRQIVHAMSFGVQRGENAAYLCLCPDRAEAWSDLQPFFSPADGEDWDTLSPEKSAHLSALFSISPEELMVVSPERIQELVLERVALLEVYR